MDNNSCKKVISETERLELAQKLDAELDQFIDSLEKRQYTEGWPEDRWEEEFEKHPFFMKKAPKVGDELHPLLEGIQQLKYDPEENTAEELAENYKEDGNFNFKHKNYRLSILSYTEGIKQKHDNHKLTSILYNNRSAANFFLKNYRSCIRDCEMCLKLNPTYLKAQIRLAQAHLELENFEKSLEQIDAILFRFPDNSEAQTLRKTVVQRKKTCEKDLRKRNKQNNAKKAQNESLISIIKSKNVKLTSNNLTPILPQIQDCPVHLSPETNNLIWPVVLLYPEMSQMDFIREFNEENTLFEQLKDVLREPAAWDKYFRYKIDNVNVYFEEKKALKVHFVNLELSLGEILAKNEYFVDDGTPCFYVFEKGSKSEINFLKSYK